MISLGTWYNEDETVGSPASYAADLKHIFGRLAAISHGQPRRLPLWVQTFPQHFHGRSGSGTWGSRALPKCAPHCAAITDQPDWRIVAADAAAGAAGISAEQIVPTAALLRPLHLLHKRTKFSCQLDCTHYCYSPPLWDALLDGLYRRLHNSASLGLTPPPYALDGGRLPHGVAKTAGSKLSSGKLGGKGGGRRAAHAIPRTP